MTSATYALPDALAGQIHKCGFYPELVCQTVAASVGRQEVISHVVHHEATFTGQDVQRHMTVLVLTDRQLVINHTDDGDQGQEGRVLTSSEVVPLRALQSAAVIQSIDHPERAGGTLVETWLTLAWGGNRRLELGPGACDDPECMAEHGTSGILAPNDLTVRMSPAGDGLASTSQLIRFGALIQERIGQ